jgi:hypothetical protein
MKDLKSLRNWDKYLSDDITDSLEQISKIKKKLDRGVYKHPHNQEKWINNLYSSINNRNEQRKDTAKQIMNLPKQELVLESLNGCVKELEILINNKEQLETRKLKLEEELLGLI